MGSRPAHFIAEADGTFTPTEFSRSRWGEDMLNGPAVVALAAATLEQQYGMAGFVPARLTVDLFKAARKLPTTTRTRLIRDGHRVRNAECEVRQGETRSPAPPWCSTGPRPPGREWSGQATFAPAAARRRQLVLHRQRRRGLESHRGGPPERLPQARLPPRHRRGGRSRRHPFRARGHRRRGHQPGQQSRHQGHRLHQRRPHRCAVAAPHRRIRWGAR